MSEPITHPRLLELVSYDPTTGDFKWRKSGSGHWLKRPDRIAGYKWHKYRCLKLDGRTYYCHRLAWFYVHGVWPEITDHINGDGLDNRIENLRSGTWELNAQNQRRARSDNKTQFLGVIFRDNKYRADIWALGKPHFLGRFDTPEKAHEAYLIAKRRFHEGCTI